MSNRAEFLLLRQATDAALVVYIAFRQTEAYGAEISAVVSQAEGLIQLASLACLLDPSAPLASGANARAGMIQAYTRAQQGLADLKESLYHAGAAALQAQEWERGRLALGALTRTDREYRDAERLLGDSYVSEAHTFTEDPGLENALRTLRAGLAALPRDRYLKLEYAKLLIDYRSVAYLERLAADLPALAALPIFVELVSATQEEDARFQEWISHHRPSPYGPLGGYLPSTSLYGLNSFTQSDEEKEYDREHKRLKAAAEAARERREKLARKVMTAVAQALGQE